MRKGSQREAGPVKPSTEDKLQVGRGSSLRRCWGTQFLPLSAGCPACTCQLRIPAIALTLLQQMVNMVGAFEHLAPGLCYGGVHKSVLQCYLA